MGQPMITALGNFRANGVMGWPGKVLTQEEAATIQPLLSSLLGQGLVSVHIQEPAPNSQALEAAPAAQPASSESEGKEIRSRKRRRE